MSDWNSVSDAASAMKDDESMEQPAFVRAEKVKSVMDDCLRSKLRHFKHMDHCYKTMRELAGAMKNASECVDNLREKKMAEIDMIPSDYSHLECFSPKDLLIDIEVEKNQHKETIDEHLNEMDKFIQNVEHNYQELKKEIEKVKKECEDYKERIEDFKNSHTFTEDFDFAREQAQEDN